VAAIAMEPGSGSDADTTGLGGTTDGGISSGGSDPGPLSGGWSRGATGSWTDDNDWAIDPNSPLGAAIKTGIIGSAAYIGNSACGAPCGIAGGAAGAALGAAVTSGGAPSFSGQSGQRRDGEGK
jgi:hypothetical protein